MAKKDKGTLERHGKVVAAEDLPGVPRGTAGRIMLVDGVTWIRYRVAFDNGVEIGTLDRRVLHTRDEFAEAERRRRLAERAGS